MEQGFAFTVISCNGSDEHPGDHSEKKSETVVDEILVAAYLLPVSNDRGNAKQEHNQSKDDEDVEPRREAGKQDLSWQCLEAGKGKNGSGCREDGGDEHSAVSDEGEEVAKSSAGDWSNFLIVTTVPTGVPVGADTLFVKTSGGTSAAIVFTIVTKVAFSPSTVSWTSTTALPVGLSGHAVAAATLPGAPSTSVVYVVGGADSTNSPRDSVLYATVSNTGTVGAWTRTQVDAKKVAGV